MKFPQHRRIGLRQPRVFSAAMAVICTVAMIAATFVAAPFAMADQDGGMRIEIDDSKSVGNWNISQKGQVVDLAVGQKVQLSVWNYQGSGQPVKFNTVQWYINGQPITMTEYDDASGQWKTVQRDADEFHAAIGLTDDNGGLTALREGEATLTARGGKSGGPIETATAQFRVHKTKFKLVRTLDSQEVTASDTTQLTAGEDMKLKYYPTFDGDGTTAQNKKYSYEFSTSMWNNPSSYQEKDGNNKTYTIRADGWRSSGSAFDFNGQENPMTNEVTVRALIKGQSTISIGALFVFRHNVATTNPTSGKTTFTQQTDELGNVSAATVVNASTPNVSVQYGSSTSPIEVRSGSTLNLGVGEIIQFSYAIAPLHTAYATQHSAHWYSNNRSVATIDSDSSRKLTAINAGTSSITVSIGGVLFPFTASVSEPKLTLSYQGKLAKPVDATNGTVMLTAGESAELTLGYAPRHDYTSLNSVSWTSSNTSVATVNATSSVSTTGATPKTTITAKAPGTVTVTGNLAGRTVTTTVKVVDATLAIVRDTHQDTADRSDDTQVSATGKTVEVTPGENFKLYTKITPAHDYASFPSSATRTTWAEDAHGSVIKLSTSGDTAMIYGLSSLNQTSSKATITARAGGKEVTTTIAVVKPQLKLTATERDAQNQDIVKDVTGTEFQLDRNKSKRLTTVVSPLHKDYAKMDMSKVSWTSDTPSIAAVSRASGEFADVQGKGEGSTKVNASLDNVTASATVKVVIPIRSVQAPATVTTYAGKAPNLPQTVHVTWDNGKETDETVNWDRIQADQYAKAGSFTVNGTVKGYSGTVRVTVRVLGMRSFDPVNVATKTGTAPVLPATVKVTWTDGTQTTEKVAWDSVALSQYRSPGTFKVNGKLNGSDIQVYATVTVSAYVLTFDANGGYVSTTSRGVAYGDRYGDLPTANRSGYSFLGWYTERSGGEQVTKNNVMGAADVTVYAHWKVTITFRDVSSSTPHSADIAWAAESGISTGWLESDGSRTFRGMDTVKRQDMAAFLRREAVRMGVADAVSWKPTATDWARFRDVNRNTPHAEDILWLAHAGISTGYPDGTYRGMEPVYRQDMAAFLHRLASKAGRGVGVQSRGFADVTDSTPHASDIRWLGGSGVSTGYPDGTYCGMVSVYRQDMAAFLHRLDALN